jgi:hypothetical protein
MSKRWSAQRSRWEYVNTRRHDREETILVKGGGYLLAFMIGAMVMCSIFGPFL